MVIPKISPSNILPLVVKIIIIMKIRKRLPLYTGTNIYIYIYISKMYNFVRPYIRCSCFYFSFERNTTVGMA